MHQKSSIVITLSLAVGTLIGFVDSRPNWDDTGVTAIGLILTALAFSAIRPRIAWLIAPAVGIPVILFNVMVHGEFGSLVALAFSALGAGIGYGIGRGFGAGGIQSKP